MSSQYNEEREIEHEIGHEIEHEIRHEIEHEIGHEIEHETRHEMQQEIQQQAINQELVDKNFGISADRVLIITGGLVDIAWTSAWLAEQPAFDFIIAADKGLNYVKELGISVDYILGDYDSVDKDVIDAYRKKNIQVKTYPCEKDYTDTNLAVLRAIDLNPDEIVILGATGTRLDHTMANIFNLKIILDKGIKCSIINENNRIRLINDCLEIKKNEQYGKYVSLLPMTTEVTGITLTGFYYPLKDYTMRHGFSVGISNEIAKEVAFIKVKSGILMIFETKD